MKTFLSFLILASFFTSKSISQIPTKPTYIFKYNFDYQTDSLYSNNIFRDFMALEIYPKQSKYYSYLRQRGMQNAAKDMADNKSLEYMTQNSSNYYGEYESEILIYDFTTKKIKVTDKPSANEYAYIENFIEPEWKVLKDTLTILNQHCQKATTIFLGRSYTAYFAPKIPISSGPWMFRGLPGLILKVTDSKNQFKFLCTEISPGGNSQVHEYNSLEIISKKKYKQLRKLKVTDQDEFDKIEYPNVTVNQTINGISMPVKRKLKPYNPLDLSNK